MTANFKLKEMFTKKKLTENIGLKITSLLIAIALWFVVVNITDPNQTKTYRNVPVRIVNSGVITEQGKTLEVIEGTDIIPVVTLKAPRTIIQEFGNSKDYIIATADMNNLADDGESVSIDFTTSKYSEKIDSVKGSVDKIKVRIENRKTAQLPLFATTSGEIESGYILGDTIPAQNQVRVAGPESVIGRIKTASVDVQVTGFTDNISTQSDIVLYDENGEVVPKKNLELNLDSVRVDVEILATKRVPIYYSTSGIPAEGYAVTGEVDITPETVVIAGSKEEIEKVSEISVPSEQLNITGQSGNMLVIADIKEYLPEGIRLGDPLYNGRASITVYIEQMVDKEFGTNLKNVEIINVPEDYSVEFSNEEDYISFVLNGLPQNLEKVNAQSIDCHVDFDDFALLNDLSEVSDGEYTFYLVMDLPDGVEVTEPVGVSVKLSKKED